MRISTEIGRLLNKGISLKECITLLADAGFDCIDLSFDGKISEEALDDWHKNAEEYVAYAKDLGICFNQAHAPFPTSFGDDKNEWRFQNTVRCMEIAAKFGVENIVVHPNQHLEYRFHIEELREMNCNFYKALEPYAKKFGIKIAIENMWRYDINRKNYITHSTCSKAEEFNEYVDMLQSDSFVACLDLGHIGLVNDDIPKFIRTMGSRIKCLHIHDVDYVHDLHTLPGMGKLDYNEIFATLKEIGYNGDLTLESGNFINGFEKDFLPTALKFMADRIRYYANKYFE